MQKYPSHIDLSDPCKEAAVTNNKGYGLAQVGKSWLSAHRVSYVANVGSFGPGAFVCHACDNPKCYNHKHLFIGTPHDNVQDMVAKGRHAHGVTHGSAKLTEADVEAIRTAPKGTRRLPSKYGVSRNVIYAVRSGRTWGHV